MAIVSFYLLGTTSVVLARSLLDGQWLATSSNSSTFHSLWEFKKRDLFCDNKFDCNFSLSGNKLTLIFKSGKKALFTLQKQGEGFIFFKTNGARSPISLNPAPKGYSAFIVARQTTSLKERVSLSKKALKKKGLPTFVINKLSALLFTDQEYESAMVGFKSINDLKNIAACNIMITATTGKAPSGVDIVSAAKLFWEANAKKHPSLKAFYQRAQAIAYACAVVGKHSLALNYQGALYRQAQRSQILSSAKMKKSGVNVVNLGKVCDLYQKQKKPASFAIKDI